MALLDFLQRRVSPSRGTPRAEPGLAPNGAGYPAVDPGIAAPSVAEILSAHDELLSRIKLCYGKDRAQFEADLLTPIRNYAAFVNLLPATADNYFAEAGGLFKLGLEVAFFALQGTDGHIVSGRATISTRRHLEPRWRHATFLAGLCSELHRTLSQVIVTDVRGAEWPAFLEPLSTWLARQRSPRFFVRWLPAAQETRALGLFALPHVVPAATMQHLGAGNTVAVPQMLACLTGIPLYREENILIDLVKRAAALVIDRNLIASASRYGRPIIGAHIERYLLDAMRRLIASNGAWAPNQERSRVWYGADGLFVVWPNAVAEIRKVLEEDQLPGIPKAPETILEILLGAGVLQPREAGQALWSILPPGAKDSIEAVRLCAPEILLPAYSDLAAPLKERLVAPARSSQAKPSGAAGAPTQVPTVAAPRPPPVQVELLPPAQGPTPSATAVPSPRRPPRIAEDGEIQQGLAAPPAETDDAAPAAGADSPGADATALPMPGAQEADAPCAFRLVAPMRLMPAVRDALSAAIETMNGEARSAAAITVRSGVFVPLDHFKGARLDLPVVLRALAELSMSSGPAGPAARTVEHRFDGRLVPGVVIKPAFVEGLDPAHFADDTGA